MDIIRFYFDTQNYTISLDISWLVVLLIILGILGFTINFFYRSRRYKMVKLNINLGNIGSIELTPNTKDLQIAHRIWTELVTRKAAIPVDPNDDVIVEIYDSWYALFKKVRELIADLPADIIRREKSTREIVRISTATLNEGLRPHLTKWQARFRYWYEDVRQNQPGKSPQEIQREFPEFNELVQDMRLINSQLIEYASELKKLLG